MTTEADAADYVLGVDEEELERLRFQHTAWLERMYALVAEAGLRAGDRVLDLGCGPGFTTLELARVVGADGHVVARDQSARYVDFLRAEAGRLGLGQVETSVGPAEALELPAGSLDAAYMRWLLCWPADPAAVLAPVVHALRPGGALVLQEYLDWATIRLVPRSVEVERAVEACMRSWHASGGTIDVARLVPELAERFGLALEHFRPVARLGAVGSLEWRWIGGFFRTYLPRLVERGGLSADERDACLAAWDAREERGGSFVQTPTMADVVLRKS